MQQHITIVANEGVNDDHLEVSSREITTTEPYPSLQLASLQDSQQRAPPSYHQHSGQEYH